MAVTATGDGLREADVRAMLGFVAELGSFEDPREFRAGILPGLRELVPCDVVTYNEIDVVAGRMESAEDPRDIVVEGAQEVFVRHADQNPIAAHFQRSRDGRARKWSDFMTRRELHQTDLYRELYARMGIEYQMAIGLPTPPETVIGVAFNRSRRDFGERDRRILDLVRAPLIRAYRTVERYAAVAARLNALERGLERGGAGVIALERGPAGPRAASITGAAREALGVAGDGGAHAALPEAARSWLAELGSSAAADASPLVLAAPGGGRVVLRFLPARGPSEIDAVLVEPVAEPLSLASLRAAGLTQRQAEVLRLVALGRTNVEIAAALELSPRTVHKHLEHVFERLGVTSRTQAVLTAWSIDRGMPATAP